MARGNLVRRMSAVGEASAVRLQAMARGKSVRRMSAVQLDSAVRLQAMARGTSVRRMSAVQLDSAMRLQAMARGNAARKLGQARHAAAVTVQVNSEHLYLDLCVQLTPLHAPMRVGGSTRIIGSSKAKEFECRHRQRQARRQDQTGEDALKQRSAMPHDCCVVAQLDNLPTFCNGGAHVWPRGLWRRRDERGARLGIGYV